MPPLTLIAIELIAIGVVILIGFSYCAYRDRRDRAKQQSAHVNGIEAENRELRNHVKELRQFRDLIVSMGQESQKSDDSVESY